MSSYAYSISTYFSRGVNPVHLCKEITDKIDVPILEITIDEATNTLNITFDIDTDLTVEQINKLNDVVSNYVYDDSVDDPVHFADPINMSGNTIINVGDPVNSNDATNRKYVDTLVKATEQEIKSLISGYDYDIITDTSNKLERLEIELRSELRTSIENTKDELIDEFDDKLDRVQSDLQAQIDDSKLTIDENQLNTQNKLNELQSYLRTDIKTQLNTLEVEIEEQITETKRECKTYTDRSIRDSLEFLSENPSGNLVSLDDVQTLTNKTIDARSNTVVNISNQNIKNLAAIDAKKISTGSVSNSEFDRLSGLKANIQNQIDHVVGEIETHASDMENPHRVTKQQLGLGNVSNIKSNWAGTIIPSRFDDILNGYSVGSIWINTTTQKGYICIENTEMRANWAEITSLGEILFGRNLGTGEGVYSNKIDTQLNFKSLSGSDNVTLSSNTNTITIQSRDSHSYLLSAVEIDATYEAYTDVICFPWLQSKFNKYRSGKLIFEAVVDSSATLGIRIKNATENSILAEMNPITVSGFYEMNVANPANNARLKLQVKKNIRNNVVRTVEPRIFGIVLTYET